MLDISWIRCPIMLSRSPSLFLSIVLWILYTGRIHVFVSACVHMYIYISGKHTMVIL